MKNNSYLNGIVLILSILILGGLIFGLFQVVLFVFLNQDIKGLLTPWLLGLAFILLFRLNWTKKGAHGVTVSVMSLVFSFLDASGNPLFDLPLLWLFLPEGGSIRTIVDAQSIVPGETTVNYTFEKLSASGQVLGNIPFLVHVLNYFICYFLVLYLFDRILIPTLQKLFFPSKKKRIKKKSLS
ncbi:MAG: hypothetical protein Q4G11_02805 [Gallicola sp.]|nr:hypothetical protein [Gallicola sp.]